MATSTRKRIGFIGSSTFGLKCLETLLSLDSIEIPGVITADKTFRISYRPEGVTNVLHADVATLARQKDIDVYVLQDRMTEPELLDMVKSWSADAILVSGWYHMIPKVILDLCPVVGLHASLLPAYSGGAPLVWAMINGEKQAGVSLFRFCEGVDNGPVLDQHREPILEHDTIATLLERIIAGGTAMVRRHMPRIERSLSNAWIQDESRRRIMPQRSPADGLINFHQPARRVYDFIRAQTRPYPGAFAWMDGKKMTIWSAKPPVPSSSAVEGAAGQVIQLDNGQPAVRCGDGKVVMLTEVQIDSFCYSGSEWIAQQTMPLVLTGQIQVQAS